MNQTESRTGLDAPVPVSGKPGKRAAPGVPKSLFAIVAAAAAALAAVCVWLEVSRGYLQSQAGELEQRAVLLEQQVSNLQTVSAQQLSQLTQAQQDLADAQQDLADAQQDLADARETIDLLEEYSLVGPDGTVPEYTALYPDFYAPQWEGETVAGGKVCCLTFDDGPSPNTDRVLAALDRYGIKGTFFVVGSSASSAASQERMRKIVEGGHTIAMHSWSHNYRKVYASVESFLEEFNKLFEYIHEVTGVYPSVFRFPGGSINGYDRGVYQEIIAEMTRRGFVYYDWNASAQDATVTPRPTWDIAADCLRGVGKDLVVVLCHDSAARGTTVDALPAVIEGYRNAGYTFSALHPGVEPVTMGYPVIR